LYAGEILSRVFELPARWLVPDVLLEEELHEPSGAWLLELGVERCELDGVQVNKVAELASRYRRPSRLDLFALVQAKDGEAILVTDDGSLREAAENEGVAVHGTLWILDLMVERHLITGSEAATSLEKMIAAGRRLPEGEVRARVEAWGGNRDER